MTEKGSWKMFSEAHGAKGNKACYVDRRDVYLVLVASQYFDTREYQKGKHSEEWPEIAVKEIPDSHIFACIPIVRVFHGTTDDKGFTVLFDNKNNIKAPNLQQCQQAVGLLAGKTLYANITAEFDKAFQAVRNGYSVAWDPHGTTPVDPLPIGKILSITDSARARVWP